MKSLFTATAAERRATLSLATIMAIRMLGLFMILPVFVLDSTQLSGATPWTIGLALGIYGLTQACLQMPFGLLSDHIGRKPVITLGLIIFASGSLLAVFCHSINGMIIARALQGAGAVGSTCIALLADCTREEQRSQSMAVLGMSIGLAFVAAMVLGPLVNHWIGLSGIFMVITGLAMVALVLLWTWVPNPSQLRFHCDAEPEPKQLMRLLKDTTLLRLNYGIACLHATLTALFTQLPPMLATALPQHSTQPWLIYLPVMALSVITMLPLVIVAESRRQMKAVFSAAIGLLIIAVFGLALLPITVTGMIMGLWLFFTGFNTLEALLPSLVSKIAPLGRKGTAIGLYSSAQFLGIFIGGSGAGWVQNQWGAAAVWWLILGGLLIWWLLTINMRKPPIWAHHMVNLSTHQPGIQQNMVQELRSTDGVLAIAFNPAHGIAYLKIDTKIVSRDAINTHVASMYTAQEN